MAESYPEPWLRGPIPGVHPLIMPAFFSFAQVREDLAKHTAGLSQEEVWRKIEGVSLGFHLRHLAGSVDRLTTYLAGRELTREQLRRLSSEHDGEGHLDELLRLVDDELTRAENELRGIDPGSLYDERTVGRKALPTTVLGLIVHICEHTQRHLGQAILLTKMLKQT